MIPLILPAIMAGIGMAAKNYGKAADERRGKHGGSDPLEGLRAMQDQRQQQGAAAGLSAYAAGKAAGAQPMMSQAQSVTPGQPLPLGGAQMSAPMPMSPQPDLQLNDPNLSAWDSLAAMRNY